MTTDDKPPGDKSADAKLSDGRHPAARSIAAGQKRVLPKRFYKDASVAPTTDGSSTRILLDGRTVRTPAKRELAVPSLALAEALAGEWRAQAGEIDPATMPLTRLVNSALDGVTGREAQVRADIVAFAGSDLVCYMAAGPAELVARQTKGWAPVHRWIEGELGVSIAVAHGVMHVAQPPALAAGIDAALAACDALTLSALHVMTTLTGSAILALAVLRRHLDAEQAWSLALIDEDYQNEKWGEDAEAMRMRAARHTEMQTAARLLDLVGN